MAHVVILPHSYSDPATLIEALTDCLGPEAKDIKVLPLLPNQNQEVTVNPSASEPTKPTRKKQFRLNEVQQHAMDQTLYEILKQHGPASMGTVLTHLRPSYPGVNDVATRKAVERLIEEGLAKYTGERKSRLYEAL